MRTLNLGILAHVDAGKTSLTERLLYTAGAIDAVGSVDDGTTRTDTLDLERRRGITIKSAVASFRVEDVIVNLVDTPGHPDFIAEVERALGVLDGAVLVVSAVEGVQPQTKVLMRTLRRIGIPALIFVNKLDRMGAAPAAVLDELARTLTPALVPMGVTSHVGTRDAIFAPYTESDSVHIDQWVDVLAEHDDALLADAVESDSPLSSERVRQALLSLSRKGSVYPVFAGSAVTGTGVGELLAAIPHLLPAEVGDADAPLSGTVFAVERGRSGERVAYARLRSGTARVRELVPFGDGREAKLTAIEVVEPGGPVPVDTVHAGRIGRLWGLTGVRVGDAIGITPADRHRHFAPPGWEAVVTADDPRDRPAAHVALTELAEQDPLINLRRDDRRDETYVSLYGEMQKEVIQSTLAEEYGVAVSFRETTTVCVERLVGTAGAAEVIKTGDNPFLATLGLRVEPGPVDGGTTFHLEVELGSLPSAFMKAIEDTVRDTLRQGLRGWQVIDARVTVFRTGYWARQSHSHAVFDKSMSSTAGDFRKLTPLVLMDAIRDAGTVVHEPMHRFRLELPVDTLTATLPVLSRLRAVPLEQRVVASALVVDGDIPAASVHRLERQLPSLTSGEGVLETVFDRFTPITGDPPSRPRSDANPLDRREYLLRVGRLVNP
ncbi:GTP-binding protein [Stackebrandtia soli]|uniref:GTP-binding protein n=1 Tax=Stackebrandtia soli TaxID=1892856 RepID=UPI0039ED4A9B